jgi:hypothetical protein
LWRCGVKISGPGQGYSCYSLYEFTKAGYFLTTSLNFGLLSRNLHNVIWQVVTKNTYFRLPWRRSLPEDRYLEEKYYMVERKSAEEENRNNILSFGWKIVTLRNTCALSTLRTHKWNVLEYRPVEVRTCINCLNVT